MGSRRIGLARTQALLEALKRSLGLSGTTMTGMTLSEGTVSDCTVTGMSVTQKSYTEDNSGGAIAVTITTANYNPGATIYVDAGTATNDVSYTLPAASAGLEYTFVFTGGAGTSVGVTLQAASTILGAILLCNDDSNAGSAYKDSGGAGNTSMVFDDNKCGQGTTITFKSDGNNWYGTGFVATALEGEITIS